MPAMTYSFPYTIEQVANILGIKMRRTTHSHIDADCCFCGKSSKLNLKRGTNQYRCNACNESGGMLHLYSKVYAVSTRDAHREILEILNCGASKPAAKAHAPQKRTKEVITSRADGKAIHQTYSMMLHMINLNRRHGRQLLARGMSRDDIIRAKIRTIPNNAPPDWQMRLCEELLDSGCTLEGVPGFYIRDGAWNVKLYSPGILIPVKDIEGNICAIQVRLDNPVGDRNYIWLSSNGMEGGASSGSPSHFVGDLGKKGVRVFVTEGPLKGNVAHSLTRYSFLCVPGVNATGGLDNMLSNLRAHGVDEIFEALDIDKKSNVHVGAAAEKLREKLSDFGFSVRSVEWSDTRFKGIDDYFWHRYQEKQKLLHSVDLAA